MTKPAKAKTTKRPRVLRTRRTGARAVAAGVAASAPSLRLPRLVAPVIRETRRDRIDLRRLAASGNCQSCFAACANLPVALQSVCHHFCTKLCTA